MTNATGLYVVGASCQTDDILTVHWSGAFTAGTTGVLNVLWINQ